MRKSPNFRKDVITHQVFEQTESHSHRLESSWSCWYWVNRKSDKPGSHRWGRNDTSMSHGVFWVEQKSHSFAIDEHPPLLPWFPTHFCLSDSSVIPETKRQLCADRGVSFLCLSYVSLTLLQGLKGHLNHSHLASVSYPETGEFQERKQHFEKTCSPLNITSINYRTLWSFSGSFARRCQVQQWAPVAAMSKPRLGCSTDRRGDWKPQRRQTPPLDMAQSVETLLNFMDRCFCSFTML